MNSPLPEPTMEAFRRAVETHFQPFAREIGADWEIVCPWVEGFSTPTIQVTIGVYHGHFPSVSVGLRPNSPPAPLGTEDGVFGLIWVREFVTGKAQTPSPRPERRLQPDTIATEVEKFADEFRQYAMPLIASKCTDWSEIQRYIQDRVQRMLAGE